VTLGSFDIAVLLIYFLGVLALGTYIGRRQHDVNDYFVGHRNVPWWAIMSSIVATETSALTFIGVPALAFATDISFIQIVVGYLIGRVVVSLLFIPSYFKGELITVYEVLNTRFGRGVQRFASAIFLVTRSLADGVRLFATAIVLVVMTGLTDIQAITIIAVITVIYCYIGGMRAVIWTDLAQLAVYVVGAIFAAIILLDDIPGGWTEVVRLGQQHHKWNFVAWPLDFTKNYTIWAGVIGGAFFTTATHGADQLMGQRYLCARSQRQATGALLGSGVIVFLQFSLFLIIGVMLFAYYTHFPPNPPLTKTDEVFPHFIVNHLPIGIRGLVIAALFAAAMSTLSSSLNSSSASTVADFYRPLDKKKDEGYDLRVARGMTVVWAFVQLIVAYLARREPSVLEAGLTIAAFTNGSLLGIFLLGVLTRRVGHTAGIIGMAIGLGFMIYISRTAVAWPWYVLIGSTVTFMTGVLASYLKWGSR
jgi:SSS family transporter